MFWIDFMNDKGNQTYLYLKHAETMRQNSRKVGDLWFLIVFCWYVPLYWPFWFFLSNFRSMILSFAREKHAIKTLIFSQFSHFRRLSHGLFFISLVLRRYVLDTGKTVESCIQNRVKLPPQFRSNMIGSLDDNLPLQNVECFTCVSNETI